MYIQLFTYSPCINRTIICVFVDLHSCSYGVLWTKQTQPVLCKFTETVLSLPIYMVSTLLIQLACISEPATTTTLVFY